MLRGWFGHEWDDCCENGIWRRVWKSFQWSWTLIKWLPSFCIWTIWITLHLYTRAQNATNPQTRRRPTRAQRPHHPRAEVLSHMIALLQYASSLGAQLAISPETAFTTLFPRHVITSQEELDTYFEHPNSLLVSPNTRTLFDEAQKLGADISVGFAGRDWNGKGYNTSVYYSAKKGGGSKV